MNIKKLAGNTKTASVTNNVNFSIDTVNTVGLPRYAKQWMSQNGKRIEMESQSNPLSYCTRPRVLLQGTTT